MAKPIHRWRLSPDALEKLGKLLIAAIESVARLIDAISRLR